MISGSTKPWRDVIKDLSPSQMSELQSSAFLEYYEPLQNWLIHDNTAKHIDVGWEYSDGNVLNICR